MKNFRYLLIALSAFALSCEREEIRPEPKVLATFDAVAEAPEQTTKVSIDSDFVLSWEADDKIKIWDGSVETLFVAKESGTSTVLQAEGVVLVPDRTYVASYPEAASSFSADGLKVKVSNTVTADPGQFPDAPAVAVSGGSERKLEFRNVCGLVSFDIVGSDIVSVTIEGGNGEILAGYVTVDPATAVYETSTIVDPSDKIELTGLLAGLYPGRYYIPMLPQNFTKGLKLSMHTTKGTVIERSFEAFDLKRSYYYDLEGIDVGRYFRYEIYTAEDLQQFLTDAKDCEAHVVAMLARDVDLTDVELTPAETFAGTFNGNGKSLKNWTAKAPLFTELAEGGVVRNLTVAASCTYALAEDSAPQAFIVGQNAGLVTECVNKASVSYALSSNPSESVARTFGTIVGVCLSKMTDCVNLGNIDLTLAAQTGAQHIGGVVGAFNSAGISAVVNCTNEGNITIVSQLPHNINVGGVCAQGCNSVPVPEADAQTVGAIKGCTNKGKISLVASSSISNVGGVIGYVEGDVNSCVNEAEGEVISKSYDDQVMSAPAVGGVAGTVVAGSVIGSSNAAQVTLAGAVQAASALAAYVGGNVDPAIGGVVAKAGKSVEDSSLKIEDSVNAGAVDVQVTGDAALNVGGVVGWTSVPVLGSAENKLENSGAVLAEGLPSGEINLGGVIGKSLSTFDKLYTTAAASVTLNLEESWSSAYRVGGVAGYMEKTAGSVFKQAQNYASVTVTGGKSGNTTKCYVGGCVGKGESTSVTSNGNGWATCNTNYGKITVNSPSVVYVGGVIGYPGRGSSLSSEFKYCKNGGDIEVTSPAGNSYIGGVFGYQNRGVLGNANACGKADLKVGITVTGATADTYVGAYVGMMYSDHGKSGSDWPTMRVSGCGIYGSIDAGDATAGVVAGRLQWSGKSTTNCVLLGSNANERPKISKAFAINGSIVGDLVGAGTQTVDTFFGKITPSSDSNMTHIGPDETAMKGRYLFFGSGNKTTNIANYMDGLQFVD